MRTASAPRRSVPQISLQQPMPTASAHRRLLSERNTPTPPAQRRSLPRTIMPTGFGANTLSAGQKLYRCSSASALSGGPDLCRWCRNLPTLSSANNYADSVGSTVLGSARTYADGSSAAALASAKSYADSIGTTTLTAANSYTGPCHCEPSHLRQRLRGRGRQQHANRGQKLRRHSSSAATLSSAQTYADAVGASTLTSANGYADSVGATTLGAAKSYTDTSSAVTLGQAKTYSDVVGTTTLTAATGYADNVGAATAGLRQWLHRSRQRDDARLRPDLFGHGGSEHAFRCKRLYRHRDRRHPWFGQDLCRYGRRGDAYLGAGPLQPAMPTMSVRPPSAPPILIRIRLAQTYTLDGQRLYRYCDRCDPGFGKDLC